MRNILSILSVFFVLTIISCGGDDCQTCTGTNSLGNAVDVTICDNGDGTWTSTNNLTSVEVSDTTDFQTEITAAESSGLECN